MQLPSFDVDQATVQQWLGGRSLESVLEQYEEQGYVVFERVLSDAQIEAARAALAPFLELDLSGRNEFEGKRSKRVYAMLDKSPVFADLVTHPFLLPFAEAEVGASCLLSACLAIQLEPGETRQPWHFDDAHLEIPRPRPAYGLSAFWAVDDTTVENGATEVLPGSHRWSQEIIPGAVSKDDMNQQAQGDKLSAEPVAVTMPAGSLMIAKGTLWHRGGANNSDQSRLIITPQYCPGWARQLENMLLAVRPERAAKLPVRVQELLGYNVHPPFMGYVDGMHPNRILKSD
ncbi:MAG: phytanoyl-CoA dioxygenase family protein [Gammaproteobacteria bacterium]|nr:phytanoyl-CoA dioxygenase family protein [Gammaproteobacteria bacterium]